MPKRRPLQLAAMGWGSTDTRCCSSSTFHRGQGPIISNFRLCSTSDSLWLWGWLPDWYLMPKPFQQNWQSSLCFQHSEIWLLAIWFLSDLIWPLFLILPKPGSQLSLFLLLFLRGRRKSGHRGSSRTVPALLVAPFRAGSLAHWFCGLGNNVRESTNGT